MNYFDAPSLTDVLIMQERATQKYVLKDTIALDLHIRPHMLLDFFFFFFGK